MVRLLRTLRGRKILRVFPTCLKGRRPIWTSHLFRSFVKLLMVRLSWQRRCRLAIWSRPLPPNNLLIPRWNRILPLIVFRLLKSRRRSKTNGKVVHVRRRILVTCRFTLRKVHMTRIFIIMVNVRSRVRRLRVLSSRASGRRWRRKSRDPLLRRLALSMSRPLFAVMIRRRLGGTPLPLTRWKLVDPNRKLPFPRSRKLLRGRR